MWVALWKNEHMELFDREQKKSYCEKKNWNDETKLEEPISNHRELFWDDNMVWLLGIISKSRGLSKINFLENKRSVIENKRKPIVKKKNWNDETKLEEPVSNHRELFWDDKHGLAIGDLNQKQRIVKNKLPR